MDFASRLLICVLMMVLTQAPAVAAGDSGQHGDHAQHAPGMSHSGHAHAHARMLEAGESAPELRLRLRPDRMNGWNLQIIATNSEFAPEAASGPHRLGQGHAHVYVDGRKLARVYGAWIHIPAQGSGTHELKVSLNTNDHRVYVAHGRAVEQSLQFEEP